MNKKRKLSAHEIYGFLLLYEFKRPEIIPTCEIVEGSLMYLFHILCQFLFTWKRRKHKYNLFIRVCVFYYMWLHVLGQCYLLQQQKNNTDLVSANLKLFAFFTIWSSYYVV